MNHLLHKANLLMVLGWVFCAFFWVRLAREDFADATLLIPMCASFGGYSLTEWIVTGSEESLLFLVLHTFLIGVCVALYVLGTSQRKHQTNG